jgi:hypothetical protein
LGNRLATVQQPNKNQRQPNNPSNSQTVDAFVDMLGLAEFVQEHDFFEAFDWNAMKATRYL